MNLVEHQIVPAVVSDLGDSSHRANDLRILPMRQRQFSAWLCFYLVLVPESVEGTTLTLTALALELL